MDTAALHRTSLHVHTSCHWKCQTYSHSDVTQAWKITCSDNSSDYLGNTMMYYTHWTYRCHALCKHWCFLHNNPYWYNLLHSSDEHGYSTLCNCLLMYTHISLLMKWCNILSLYVRCDHKVSKLATMTLLPLIQTSSATSRKREQLESFANPCNIQLFCNLYDFHSFRKLGTLKNGICSSNSASN